MKEIILFLQSQYPNSIVFESLDKDYICIRHTIGESRFGKNDKGEDVIVPITVTERYHIDTIRLKFNLKNPYQ